MSSEASLQTPVLLVRGGQALLADRFVKEVSKRFLGDEDSGEVSVFYADETSVREVIANASNLPMFSSKKVVVLKRAEILDKNSIELVNRYSLSPSLHTRLILVSGESSKPNMKLTQGIFIKDVGRSSKKIHEKALEEADKMGLVMETSAAKYLCALAGEDLSVITNELAKLTEIQSPGVRIKRADIDQMLERRKSRDIFEFTNAIVDGEKDQALAILAEIASQSRIEPLFILSTLSSRIRNVLRAVEIRENYKLSSAEEQKKIIAEKLKIKSGAAHFIWKQSHNFAQNQTGLFVRTLAETDRALKTSSSRGYETLARMTVNLLAGRWRAHHRFPVK